MPIVERSFIHRCAAKHIFLAATVLLAGAGLDSVDQAQAQGVVSRGPSATASTRTPAGPGLSRLPLTSEAVFPLGGTTKRFRGREGTPGVGPRASGGAGKSSSAADEEVAPSAYGTFRWPFTMARVANTNIGFGAPLERVPVTGYPFRPTGKLWMLFGKSWFVCSASLIKKGILVTAAHCVHNYGQKAAGWADRVIFYPANVSNSMTTAQPYGAWVVRRYFIPSVYYNGTDTCQAGAIGVVCNNDIAVLVVRTNRQGTYLGNIVGWYTYGWNGYSYTTSNQFGREHVADITQLGYPVAWDSGYQMERNNSFGKRVLGTGTNGKQLLNTQLGSAMTGGSSGGPWMVNFGTNPAITGAASAGSRSARLVVVGTTSWGYTSLNPKVQGASYFGQNNEFPGANYGGYGAGNIGRLVQAACTAFPTYC
jgi:Trypsin